MTFDYKLYLRSQAWDELRRQALEDADFTCDDCGKTGVPLHVHHIEYPKSFEDDSLENLEVLCEMCHFIVHNRVLCPYCKKEFFDQPTPSGEPTMFYMLNFINHVDSCKMKRPKPKKFQSNLGGEPIGFF